MKDNISLSKATLQRLPTYYNYVRERVEDHQAYISSTAMAESLHLNSIQVRKDMAMVSKHPGTPRLGFDAKALMHDMATLLGYNNVHDAVLVGTGHLGRTLLLYEGFEEYGLHIVAAFDNDPALVNSEVGGVRIFPMNELKHIIRRLNINIGIITVPKQEAQNVCDLLVEAGTRGIWNFAPAHLELPDGVVIQNVNLAASLAFLSHKIAEVIE